MNNDISNFSIEEHLDLFSKQYSLEMSKKQQLEVRSGIVLSLGIAFAIMLFDKINLTFIDSIYSVITPADFIRLILCFYTIFLIF